MAGHILRLQRKTRTYSARRHGEVHSKKTWTRYVSASMEPAGSPVTETDGDFSSPDAPIGTGGPKP